MKKLFKNSNKCLPGGLELTKTSINKEDNKRKKVITISLVIILLMLTIGISFAVWNYGFVGGANTIDTGNVSIEFLESNTNIINIENALPISDTDGKKQSETFDFSVKTTTSKQMDIIYGVYLEKLDVETGAIALADDEVKVYLTDYEGNVLLNPTKISELNSENMIYADTNTHDGTNNEISKKFKLRVWLDEKVEASKFYDENTKTVKKYQYKFKVGVKTKDNLDTSGANAPVPFDNMIAVYYDEKAEVWKKADSTNNSKTYKWYDYNDKMWANSVTVSETNRSTYLNADPGTTIPMDDILTMQVWVPRYKYKVWNYNEDGTVASDPQEIEITFENGTATTGEITCSDSISGTDGDPSETCKLKSDNSTCTDSTCNGKTYTHPAFTFGTQELEGIWVGKFEVSAPTDNTCYTSEGITNCNKTGITPLVKPDVKSYRYAQVGTFETNIMAMNDNGNIYGFASTDDTHMMKNMEWGAVAYLSHSKYGINKEININNSSRFYTGRSGGSTSASSTEEGTYKYNDNYNKNTTITGGTTITPTITNDTTYPWTETDGLYKSSTQGVNSSTTNLTFSFTAPSDNTYLSFDWSVSSEIYDYIYYKITKDGTTLSDTGTSTKIGGTTLGTTEDALTYKNVLRQLETGSYEITFTYVKDSSDARGTDTGYVKNIKILDSPTENTELTPIGEGKDGPSASTTGNIYGIYDMSGGAFEYVMGNIVYSDGTTMMSGYTTSQNSGYTGIIYDSGNYTSYTETYSYPENKYLDKYSFGTSNTQKKRSKLGDAVKEVTATSSTGWYSDYGYVASASGPWFRRGGYYYDGSSAGVMGSYYSDGVSSSVCSARVVVLAP